jgi:chemosensory pili system protein ChpB (putative protein-glutamate methylesterase)
MAEHPSAVVAQRVALLARPGKAADNLADALRQAGAELVLVADPNALDEQALLNARLQAVLVALEPGIEQAVDRLDAVLSSPDLTVIFDEADLAAHRAGWDAARWVRHLSAKLNHHQQVLPPGGEAETDEWYPSPGQLPKPTAAFAELNLDAFAEEAAVRAGDVPIDAMNFDAIVQEAAQAARISAEPTEPAAIREAPAVAELSLDTLPLDQLPRIEAPLPFEETILVEERLVIEQIPVVEDSLSFEDNTVDESDLRIDDGLRVEEISTIESNFAEADSSGVQPMRFDDDAFFLEELSADAAKAATGNQALDFDFESIPVFDDETPSMPVAAERTFDLEVVDLSFEPRQNEGLSPSPDVVSMSEPARDPRQDDAPAAVSPELARPTFGELSLATDDVPLPTLPRTAAPKHDLSSIESRISSLSLVDLEPDDTQPEAAQSSVSDGFPRIEPIAEVLAESVVEPVVAHVPEPVRSATPIETIFSSAMPPPLPSATASWNAPAVGMPTEVKPVSPVAASPRGIVLIEAGLGGPDPVRQVLAGLPSSFAIPVLVRLHLQGGRYDRLVTQMERAASLPVRLAEVGQPVGSGCIYFLPEGVGLQALSNGMSFIAHPSPAATIFAALPTEDSAVLFLSGSDSALVEDAVQAADTGALVAAQSPEDCYDGAACAYLRSRGAASGLPTELARSLLARWPS